MLILFLDLPKLMMVALLHRGKARADENTMNQRLANRPHVPTCGVQCLSV